MFTLHCTSWKYTAEIFIWNIPSHTCSVVMKENALLQVCTAKYSTEIFQVLTLPMLRTRSNCTSPAPTLCGTKYGAGTVTLTVCRVLPIRLHLPQEMG